MKYRLKILIFSIFLVFFIPSIAFSQRVVKPCYPFSRVASLAMISKYEQVKILLRLERKNQYGKFIRLSGWPNIYFMKKGSIWYVCK